MDNFEQVKAVAMDKCIKFGRPDLGDDFCQFASEAKLHGRKATMSQLFIDFIRLEFGRKEEPCFKFGRSVELESYMEEQVVDQHDLDFSKMVDKFEGVERSILILYYVWGMSMREIGHAIGLSESAISLRMTNINNRLVKRYANC